MMKVTFKALIPQEVKVYMLEKGYNDLLLEGERRLNMKLSNLEHFRKNGKVLEVKYDEQEQMIGMCTIIVNANNQEDAKMEFSQIFKDMAKRGQKFKYESFLEVK